MACGFPGKRTTMNIDPEERERRAMSLFREGYNCSQAVALAFSDVIASCNGMTEAQISSAAGGFGGGFARLREVCGCVSGMTFVAGVLKPSPAAPGCHGTSAAGSAPSAMGARKECYALVQELAAEFREENGSIICRELLGLRTGQSDAPGPSERTAEFYKARPCERLVGSAARILAGQPDILGLE